MSSKKGIKEPRKTWIEQDRDAYAKKHSESKIWWLFKTDKHGKLEYTPEEVRNSVSIVHLNDGLMIMKLSFTRNGTLYEYNDIGFKKADVSVTKEFTKYVSDDAPGLPADQVPVGERASGGMVIKNPIYFPLIEAFNESYKKAIDANVHVPGATLDMPFTPRHKTLGKNAAGDYIYDESVVEGYSFFPVVDPNDRKRFATPKEVKKYGKPHFPLYRVIKKGEDGRFRFLTEEGSGLPIEDRLGNYKNKINVPILVVKFALYTATPKKRPSRHGCKMWVVYAVREEPVYKIKDVDEELDDLNDEFGEKDEQKFECGDEAKAEPVLDDLEALRTEVDADMGAGGGEAEAENVTEDGDDAGSNGDSGDEAGSVDGDGDSGGASVNDADEDSADASGDESDDRAPAEKRPSPPPAKVTRRVTKRRRRA